MNLPGWMRGIVNLLAPPLPRYSGPLAAKAGGMLINTESALAFSAVWRCVRVISESIAGLEWKEQRTDDDGDISDVKTNLNWILNKQANPEMTAFSWRECVMAHLLLVGNHYSEIERDAMGRPLWLRPIRPESVRPWRDEQGNLIYRVFQYTGGEVILQPKNMLHVKGLGWDGLVGYSVLAMARRSIGNGLAMDEFGNNFFANGTHVGMVFTHPRQLSEQAHDRLKKSVKENQSGPGNAFRALFLEEGMTINKMQMTMTDAQFIESRKQTAIDICKWFGVPPHMIAELDRATFSNIEQQAIEFVRFCVIPWCRRLEQEVDIKLYGRGAQLNTTTRLDVDPLLQGDFLSRCQAYTQARNAGWLSANDIRVMERKNKIKNGDIYIQPLNYTEAGQEPVLTPTPGKQTETEPIEAPASGAAAEGAPASNVSPIRVDALRWARERKMNG